MMGLTARQTECLSLIQAAQAEGRSPTFQELADGLGVRSKSAVSWLIDALEERGLIRRMRNHARAFEIVPAQEIFAPFLTAGTKAVVLAAAEAERTTPQVIISEWIAERAEHEARAKRRAA